jgi:hypothetical protein
MTRVSITETFRVSLSDLEGAEASFLRAIELAPNWTELNVALAAVRQAKQMA